MGHRIGRTQLHQLVRKEEEAEAELMPQAAPPSQSLQHLLVVLYYSDCSVWWESYRALSSSLGYKYVAFLLRSHPPDL
jgi:hypothetical protein